jgi:hypothetical protein
MSVRPGCVVGSTKEVLQIYLDNPTIQPGLADIS